MRCVRSKPPQVGDVSLPDVCAAAAHAKERSGRVLGAVWAAFKRHRLYLTDI